MSNTSTSTTNTTKPSGPPPNLFDYTEEQLADEWNYYEILNVSPYATMDEIKKAYRKCSLKYHPDKTGRGDDDYVFLVVKQAYDTLHDHNKRQAYDSTTLPFDDSIPSKNDNDSDSDDEESSDFYETFRPVFERNLRFDARLRPDLKTKSNHTHKHNKQHKPKPPPILGDASTNIHDVHVFYDYWIHFESWRDFTAQAADVLEMDLDHINETAESRYEKRFYQKEVDKKAKQLKKQENTRIQTLVERAMEADPRLKQHRLEQQRAKALAKEQRQQQLDQKKQEAEDLKLQQQQQLEREKQERLIEKQQREQQKKLLRKERQRLRKLATSNNNDTTNLWKDTYERDQDVEFLCQTLDLEQLKELLETVHNNSEQPPMQYIYDRVQQERRILREKEQEESNAQQQKTTNGVSNGSSSTSKNNNWSKEELSALAKGVKKYPPGGASRWDSITSFINNLCKTSYSKEECIAMYNQIARKTPNKSNNNKNSSNNSTTNGTTNNNNNNTSSNKNSVDDANGAVPEKPTNTVEPANGNSTKTAPTTDTTAVAATTPSTATEEDWNAEQDQQLQDALAKFPASLEKNERWTSIAKSVPGKTKKQCVQRFKAIREALKNKK